MDYLIETTYCGYDIYVYNFAVNNYHAEIKKEPTDTSFRAGFSHQATKDQALVTAKNFIDKLHYFTTTMLNVSSTEQLSLFAKN